MTVTDKRISIAVQQLDRQLCSVYEKDFPAGAAGDVFWVWLINAVEELAKKMSKRPITPVQINNINRGFLGRFREQCRVERARDKAS